jgi:hypothetical protein
MLPTPAISAHRLGSSRHYRTFLNHICAGLFFWGWISAQREQSNRLAATLAEAPNVGSWIVAHGGWATFHPTKDDMGKSYRTLIIHLPELQRTDVGTTTAGKSATDPLHLLVLIRDLEKILKLS